MFLITYLIDLTMAFLPYLVQQPYLDYASYYFIGANSLNLLFIVFGSRAKVVLVYIYAAKPIHNTSDFKMYQLFITMLFAYNWFLAGYVWLAIIFMVSRIADMYIRIMYGEIIYAKDKL